MTAPILCSMCSAARAVIRRHRLCVCTSCAEHVRAAMLGPGRTGYADRRVEIEDGPQLGREVSR